MWRAPDPELRRRDLGLPTPAARKSGHATRHVFGSSWKSAKRYYERMTLPTRAIPTSVDGSMKANMMTVHNETRFDGLGNQKMHISSRTACNPLPFEIGMCLRLGVITSSKTRSGCCHA